MGTSLNHKRILSIFSVLFVALYMLSGVYIYYSPVLSYALAHADRSDADTSITYELPNEEDLQVVVQDSDSIRLPRHIEIIHDGVSTETVTLARTVSESLDEMEIVIGDHDEVYPPADFRIAANTVVRIVRVEKSQTVETEEIPFKTEEVKDDTIEDGVTVVAQEGTPGTLTKTYEHIVKDGQVVSSELISEVVTVQPQNKVVKIGTKIVPKTEVVNGEKITYYKKYWAWATSYDSSCAGCSNTTALGYELDYGIIAADPRYIPWRSRVYVPGYGYAVMADTGGAMRQAANRGEVHIDLAFKDVRNGWWSARHTWVYVLYEE